LIYNIDSLAMGRPAVGVLVIILIVEAFTEKRRYYRNYSL